MSNFDNHRKPHPLQVVALIAGIVFVFIILCSATAECQTPNPIPQVRESVETPGPSPVPLPAGGTFIETQWTSAAHLLLAQCVVGEAGWTNTGEHLAIAGALRTQFEQRRRALPALTFRAQVKAYCKGASPKRLKRQWIRQLPHGVGPWPAGAGRRNRKHWARVLQRLQSWAEGRLKSPCPGAMHWGGMAIESDSVRARRAIDDGRWARVGCSVETKNDFFRVVKSEGG